MWWEERPQAVTVHLGDMAQAADLPVASRQFLMASSASLAPGLFVLDPQRGRLGRPQALGTQQPFRLPVPLAINPGLQELTHTEAPVPSAFRGHLSEGRVLHCFPGMLRCRLSTPPFWAAPPFLNPFPLPPHLPPCILRLTVNLHPNPRLRVCFGENPEHKPTVYLSSPLLIPSCQQVHAFPPTSPRLAPRLEARPCGRSYSLSRPLLGVKWSTR